MNIKEFIENIGLRNIKVSSVENMENYKIITIQGGLNGHGKFNYYLQQIVYIEEELNGLCSDIWLISWINDCIDDIWTLKLGVKE